jgi:hypothetical protein
MKPKKIISKILGTVVVHPKIVIVGFTLAIAAMATIMEGLLMPQEVLASPTLPLPPPCICPPEMSIPSSTLIFR